MAEPVLISADVKRTLFIRQIVFLFAIAASVAIGVYVVLWSQKPNFSLLYGSLSDQDASAVIESLQKSNIDYHVDQNSGAVMVASSKVHEARMKLAAEGLPKSANSGFAMLNEEQKLGTSQFIEKARYQNALENELAMSISKVSAVKAARIHLALPKESVFLRNRKAASASVLLDLYPGHRLDAGQVAAISNLVASSVPSLELENVSIIDQYGRLLTQNQSSAELALTASQFQYATQVENSYIKRIENILMPLLGQDGVKAQVTAEFDFTSTEQSRESYNPDLSALRSEQMEEDSQSSSGRASGVPGALSNQPGIDGSAPEIVSKNNKQNKNDKSGTGSMQRRSTRNYELDKTISHTRLPTGSLLRLSVAVVIDYKKILDDKGTVARVEHTPEELDQMTTLIKETIGFNAIRGDSVNIMNAKFSVPAAMTPLPEAPIWQQAWVWDIAKQVLGGLFVLFLVFGILKPAIKNMMNKEITLHQTALAGPDGVAGQLTVAADDGLTPQAREMKALEAAPEYDKSISNVKEMVNTDPKLAAQVVRNWVGEE
jgi:flagellar M-ring protein FliF